MRRQRDPVFALSMSRQLVTQKRIGMLLVNLIAVLITGCADNADSNKPWSPGRAPQGGWTIPGVFEKAVADGFSGAVLVRHSDEILLDDAAGLADRDLQIPNERDTVFTMGSITKQYTAALVMALQENGLLNVEDTLSQHFIDVPAEKAAITIHQLLTHTAGLFENYGRDDDRDSRDDFLRLVWAEPSPYVPGARFAYSNAGYSIVTAIVESITGLSYEVALNEYLLAPSGIYSTGYVLPDWSGRTIATGYFETASRPGTGVWADDGPYWHLRGNGGLLTTTADMLKWHDVLSGTDVLSFDSIDALQGRYIDTMLGDNSYYGYGWITDDTPLGPVHWHDGSNGFHFSQILRFADEDLVVIVLSNEDNQVSIHLPQVLARVAAPSLGDWRINY